MPTAEVASPTADGRASADASIDASVNPSASELRSAALQVLAERILVFTPHVIVDTREDGTLLWADARGLPAKRVARGMLRAARHAKVARASVGVSRVAVVAEVAARVAASRLTIVAPGSERQYLAPHPLALIASDRMLPRAATALTARVTNATSERRTRSVLAALADVGIDSCEELAQLTREAIEVRFGVDAVALWQLARADDPRRVFRERVRTLPSSSLEWFEFELRDPERLVFVANRLAEHVCTELQAQGETARAMTLTFAMVGGTASTFLVRSARATADRAAWLRLVRSAFERITLPDAVCGLTLSVNAAQTADAPQGDLFDAGFQTGSAGESAIARLVDDETGTVVQLAITSHPLPELRVQWTPLDATAVAHTMQQVAHRTSALVSEPLALRLLAVPRRVLVTTKLRRGFAMPVRYRERTDEGTRTHHGKPLLDVVTAAGPDSVSVGHASGSPVIREYWQSLTNDGQLVFLFHDVAPSTQKVAEPAPETWYLHGWWD